MQNTSIGERAELAKVLHKHGQTDEALSKLEGRLSFNIPSSALRLYLELLLESKNKDAAFQKIYGAIPEEVHERLNTKPLYTHFLINIGSYESAEVPARELSESIPPQYHDKLVYARVLLRNNKHEKLSEYLNDLAEIPFKTDPKVLMEFGIYNFKFGNKQLGLKQIYAGGMLNQSELNIVRDYWSFISLHSKALLDYFPLDIETVQTGHAIKLQSGNEYQWWILEEDESLRPSSAPNYLPPDSVIGKILIGKNLGDRIKLSPEDVQEWEIIQILNKEIHLYQIATNIVGSRHGEIESIQKVPIDKSLPEAQQLEPIFSKLRERNHCIQKIWQSYQSGSLAFRTFCNAIGASIWEVYDSLSSMDGILKVCEGQHQERESAIEAIKLNNKKGFVADLLTCHALYKLDLLDLTRAVLGRAYISNNTRDIAHTEYHRTTSEQNQPSANMGYRDGQYYPKSNLMPLPQ